VQTFVTTRSEEVSSFSRVRLPTQQPQHSGSAHFISIRWQEFLM